MLLWGETEKNVFVVIWYLFQMDFLLPLHILLHILFWYLFHLIFKKGTLGNMELERKKDRNVRSAHVSLILFYSTHLSRSEPLLPKFCAEPAIPHHQILSIIFYTIPVTKKFSGKIFEESRFLGSACDILTRALWEVGNERNLVFRLKNRDDCTLNMVWREDSETERDLL